MAFSLPATHARPPISPTVEPIPPLTNGDRLSRAEFERRYDAMPHVKKAELIDGVVYMPSPVRFNLHAEQHCDLTTLIGIYRFGTDGVRSGDNASIRLDMDSEPQPDVVLFIDPERGGQARIDDDGYIQSAPEMAAEVSSSSVSHDLGVKLQAYQRNGIREYVVWRVLDRAIDWFVLRGAEYQRLAAEEGVYRSETFPGLWLDTAALLAGDRAKVLEVLHEGLRTPAHGAFVARLSAAAPPQLESR